MARIGLVTSAVGSPNLVERERAYVEAARSAGLDVVVERAERTDYEGGTLAASLLLSPQRRIEGVFCVNDLMALGVIDYARNMLGLAIPSDLSVIGFDDIPQASWGAYRLTTFQQSAELQAREILRILDKRLSDPHAPPIVSELDVPLIMRDTVRSPKRGKGRGIRPWRHREQRKGQKNDVLAFHLLQPCRADLDRLQNIVSRLADKLETPRFIPHLTIVEDMERSASDLAQVLDSHFVGEPAFSTPVTGIHGLPQFFRSLYAAFEAEGRLRALKMRAVDAFGVGSVETFMPHISLAYGVSEEQRKAVETDFVRNWMESSSTLTRSRWSVPRSR